MPRGYEIEQQKMRDAQKREEDVRKRESEDKKAKMLRQSLVCDLCNKSGHESKDCNKRCHRKYCEDQTPHHYTNCTSSNKDQDQNQKPHTEESDKKQVNKKQVNKKQKPKCNICYQQGHEQNECNKVCKNPKCQCESVEPHHYQYCNHRRCRRCFSQHSKENECNYESGESYIIGQYKKFRICECIGVQFWCEKMNPKCIQNYDGSRGPFFKAYPKPQEYKYCTNPVFCGMDLGGGEICKSHHSCHEHNLFC